MFPFRVLYCFESPSSYIFEAKRTDLPKDADRKDIYHWFRFHRTTHHLERLTFASMTNDSSEQSRTFVEAKLFFNSEEGTFQNNVGEHYPVKNVSSQELPDEIQASVLRWLQG